MIFKRQKQSNQINKIKEQKHEFIKKKILKIQERKQNQEENKYKYRTSMW